MFHMRGGWFISIEIAITFGFGYLIQAERACTMEREAASYL